MNYVTKPSGFQYFSNISNKIHLSNIQKGLEKGTMDSGSSIRRKVDVDELSSVNMARDLPVKELLDLISRGFSQHLYIFVLIMERRL